MLMPKANKPLTKRQASIDRSAVVIHLWITVYRGDPCKGYTKALILPPRTHLLPGLNSEIVYKLRYEEEALRSLRNSL